MARPRAVEDAPADATTERNDELRRLFINHEKKVYKRFAEVTRENILDLAEYINSRDDRKHLFVVIGKDGHPALARAGYTRTEEPTVVARVGEYLTDEGQTVGAWERREWTPSDEESR
jgi:hypothetical protein